MSWREMRESILGGRRACEFSEARKSAFQSPEKRPYWLDTRSAGVGEGL